MAATLADLAQVVEAFAPLSLAESWDRPGLQIGDPDALADPVLVALDPSLVTVSEAVRRGARAVVTHHPLWMHPLERLDLSTPAGRVVSALVEGHVGLYAAHTNLDRAEGGVNDWLAHALGLASVRPLGGGEPQVKLVVTVPLGYEDPVHRALAEAGAGRIGAYEGCGFGCVGEGRFTPKGDANPWVGRPGCEEQVIETRLEMVVPKSRLGGVVRSLGAVHPYEEPAVDVYPLEGRGTTGALGGVGTICGGARLGAWASEAACRLGVPGVRVVGDPKRVVETVAVVGGSGASSWRSAKDAGAQLLVTGDVKHHDALDARAAGVAILDVGHAPGEQGAVEVLAELLCDGGFQVESLPVDDPLCWVPGGRFS